MAENQTTKGYFLRMRNGKTKIMETLPITY